MSKNKQQTKITTKAFEDAAATVKTLRGGVKAYLLIAAAAEPDEDGATDYVLSGAGQSLDTLKLMVQLQEYIEEHIDETILQMKEK